ncbi:LuxR C-terminal-related transcriptional regulator [Streptomyces sp. H10-C2]|uniref:LuxR C-terminal-related transcriptional regulator n=1 Tax=unclassified Streptomyces TaxID=2593676 RepID=UPI0024BB3FE9|nr:MULTISPECIES: LuxR C-terminal-related transcriptional regulator [unclassified Streptomyces]MDJ0342550.1 LuxR C-terminal-related transcriptional regulator [Streptomyces sp. PH10-H1]MDJ0370553.1 LuxR C-terminal-related transcriptional regulator [Streptomyces sp. H10-C2]
MRTLIERAAGEYGGASFTNQQITGRMQLSAKTVETYPSRIFKNLGVVSRTQVAHLVGARRPSPLRARWRRPRPGVRGKTLGRGSRVARAPQRGSRGGGAAVRACARSHGLR